MSQSCLGTATGQCIAVFPARSRIPLAPKRKATTGGGPTERLQSAAGLGTVRGQHLGSLARTPLASSPVRGCAGNRALAGAPVHYERYRPEQTTLYCLVQQHAATFFAQAKAVAGAELPQFVKVEFDAFLECDSLAHGFLRPRCGDCGYDKLVAYSCKRRGSCPSCGARRLAQTPAHLATTSSRTCRCASGC